jgi:hypothetical protein
MNLKLITTHKDYILLVDTEAPIEGMKTLVWNEVAGWMSGNDFRCTVSLSKENPLLNDINVFEGIHAIIAHLPLNNAPVLEGVPVLPELPKQEEDFDLDAELTKLNTPFRYDSANKRYNYTEGDIKELLRKATSQNRRYTEEDMKKSFEAGQLDKSNNWYGGDINQYLQSLSPVTLPVGFEPEYDEEHPYQLPNTVHNDESISINGLGYNFKTIKNDKGQDVLVGRYIYE